MTHYFEIMVSLRTGAGYDNPENLLALVNLCDNTFLRHPQQIPNNAIKIVAMLLVGNCCSYNRPNRRSTGNRVLVELMRDFRKVCRYIDENSILDGVGSGVTADHFASRKNVFHVHFSFSWLLLDGFRRVKVNSSRLHGECIAIRELEISAIKLLQLPW